MFLDKETNKWLSKYVEQSKTIEHYLSHNLIEVARIPAYLSSDGKHAFMMSSEQMSHLAKMGTDILEVTVGGYYSYFIHVDAVPL